MKRTMARWMAEKQALERLEAQATADLSAKESSDRREALTTLLSISREPRS